MERMSWDEYKYRFLLIRDHKNISGRIFGTLGDKIVAINFDGVPTKLRGRAARNPVDIVCPICRSIILSTNIGKAMTLTVDKAELVDNDVSVAGRTLTGITACSSCLREKQQHDFELMLDCDITISEKTDPDGNENFLVESDFVPGKGLTLIGEKTKAKNFTREEVEAQLKNNIELLKRRQANGNKSNH